MIRHLRFATLYMALGLGANAVMADGLEDLLVGDMRAMVIHEEPQDIADVSFTDPDGNDLTLENYEGQYVLLNFWATWCAPCREEMPALDALQRDLGGEEFAVITIATGRNPLPAIQRFFAEIDVTDLPILLDPRQSMARAMGVFGLPITVLIDPDGQEIGRLRGDADWASEEAVALINAVIGSEDT